MSDLTGPRRHGFTFLRRPEPTCYTVVQPCTISRHVCTAVAYTAIGWAARSYKAAFEKIEADGRAFREVHEVKMQAVRDLHEVKMQAIRDVWDARRS
ncbi:hypothetical protein HXX76_000612 [Chlamydomonas incerta]|uniref:Uncharacterized protein n=1 Tax=Chlamydomonas incerta TaxID=51695 RepID=A0A835WEF4_CHLIN|nr:hypothetical protein HXX76_000612 [Chlamydomonas incerta]|eukprot:KAG2446009.1 hypothetical protein HXX76_000612 [Chlamydomonas incerta]